MFRKRHSWTIKFLLQLQWPPVLKPRSPVASNMPGMVLDRYNAVQKGCFCGVFPEIKRAWASVDNSLFLWRYDRW